MRYESMFRNSWVLGLLVLSVSVATAQVSLDPTFSRDGVTTDGAGVSGTSEGRAAAIQTDGKVVVAGYSQYGTTFTCGVSRYNSDGSLDSSFDFDGQAFVPINDTFLCVAIAIQADGNIVVAGDRFGGPLRGFSAARFNSDGSMDASFGGNGRVVTDMGTTIYRATSIAVQADGKIIVGGNIFTGESTDFALIRYTADGSLDTSFDGDGRVTTSVGTGSDFDTLNGLGLQSDGKIIATGSSDSEFALVRYNTNGSLDTTFDGDGKVKTGVGTSSVANTVMPQADDKILAGGTADVGGISVFAVVRYNTDGSLDTSFDDDGRVTTQVGNRSGYIQDLAIQPDAKIVVAGYSSETLNDTSFAAARYNPNGSLDTSFDNDGKVVTNFENNSASLALLLQSDGKIVTTGSTGESVSGVGYYKFALARYNPNGSLDSGFDGDGKVVSGIGFWYSTAKATAIQPDGKIVVVGDSFNGANRDFSVVRYTPDGLLDPTFGGDGRVITPILNGDDIGNAVAIQPDGKILVAGSTHNGENHDFAFVRYNPDGSLDNSLGADGRISVRFSFAPNAQEIANSVVIQPDGKIVAAGTVFINNNNDFGIVRLHPNGAPDDSFDGDGKTTTNTGGFFDSARTVALLSDGKIIAAGDSSGSFVVVRYNPNGSLDTTFGGGGLNGVQTGGRSGAAAIQPDGKIVVVGEGNYDDGLGLDTVVARFNANGSLDGSFSGGRVITQMASNSRANAVTIRPDGKILVAGLIDRLNPNNDDFMLARYNPDGSLDGLFANGGIRTLDVFDGSTDEIGGVATDARGKVVAAGTSNGLFAVARFTIDVAPFDFDGDGRTDISIYRPGAGQWWVNRSSTGGTSAVQFGVASDKIVPSDYTGDGRADIAVWRPSTGEWFILRSEDGAYYGFQFGANGDIPVPADYDADGKTDVAVYRPSNSVWYILRSSGGFQVETYGTAGDIPVPGRYDGDRNADLAIYRPSAGQWWIRRSSNSSTLVYQLGNSADKPIQGDYTGDGRTDAAIFRPSTGEWFVIQSENGGYYGFPFGTSGDIPAAGDYDGDGRFDPAVFRPSSGNWFLNRSTAGFLVVGFGTNGDTPVPSAFVP